MKNEYEMTQEDCDRLLEAGKPVTCMLVGGFPPASPQESANAAWRALGKKMGFDYMTAEPIHGKSMLHFRATPTRELADEKESK